MIENSNYRILITDDDPENLQVLKKILQPAGYKLSFATNGEDALNLVEKLSPDLVLLDIMMPILDGYEVCSILHNNPETSDIPIIFITGIDDNEDETKGLELGAVDYIIKPVSAPIVRTRVKNHLNLYVKNKRLNEIIKFFTEKGHKDLVEEFFEMSNM